MKKPQLRKPMDAPLDGESCIIKQGWHYHTPKLREQSQEREWYLNNGWAISAFCQEPNKKPNKGSPYNATTSADVDD